MFTVIRVKSPPHVVLNDKSREGIGGIFSKTKYTSATLGQTEKQCQRRAAEIVFLRIFFQILGFLSEIECCWPDTFEAGWIATEWKIACQQWAGNTLLVPTDSIALGWKWTIMCVVGNLVSRDMDKSGIYSHITETVCTSRLKSVTKYLSAPERAPPHFPHFHRRYQLSPHGDRRPGEHDRMRRSIVIGISSNEC